MPEDATLEEIPEEECRQLLAGQSVGRIAGVSDDQPFIFPVNYVIDGTTVAFRTDPGMMLDAVSLARVAFEVDHVEPDRREGWSVMVRGIGREITDGWDAWSRRITAHDLEPWAAGSKEHWVAIASPHISGRRVRRP